MMDNYLIDREDVKELTSMMKDYVDNNSSTTITASNVDSESATSGQVLTADGAGGASFANIPTPSGVVTLGTEEQIFDGDKTLYLQYNKKLNILSFNQTSNKIVLNPENSEGNPTLEVRLTGTNYVGITKLSSSAKITHRSGGTSSTYSITLPNNNGTFALTSDIDAKVPDAPSTDGTYTLKCVVSDGGTTKTYQWVLDA